MTNYTGKISVLIPVYNRQEYLLRSVESILNQTYKNLEVIIYDDGSTDNSFDLMFDLSKKDKRIHLIKGTKNTGVWYSRNMLLSACNTDFACWHDSDDISLPSRIELQLKLTSDKTLVFGKWQWLVLDKINEWVCKDRHNTDLATPSMLFPMRQIRQNNLLFEKMHTGEDWGFINRLTQYGLCKIETKEIVYYLRNHSDRISNLKRHVILDNNYTYEENLKRNLKKKE